MPKEMREPSLPGGQSAPPARLWGWLALLITVVYAALALIDLGSTNVPRTWYEPKQIGESFTIDLGSQRTPDRLYLFTGVGEGRYQVDISADGHNWQP